MSVRKYGDYKRGGRSGKARRSRLSGALFAVPLGLFMIHCGELDQRDLNEATGGGASGGAGSVGGTASGSVGGTASGSGGTASGSGGTGGRVGAAAGEAGSGEGGAAGPGGAQGGAPDTAPGGTSNSGAAGAAGAASVNVDECSEGTDNCSSNATCLDTTNSFVCTCNDGYVGNGVTCSPVCGGGQTPCAAACCGSGQDCCNNRCVTLNTNDNCGACAATCGTGASCNSTSRMCTCRTPSATNILTNPGFDGTSTGWDFFLGTSWSTEDAEQCSASGSIKVEVAPNLHVGTFFQCRPTAPGVTYVFGYKYKQEANVNLDCDVNLFASSDCKTDGLVGGVSVQTAQVGVALDWTNSTPQSLTTPAGAKSIQVICQLNSPGVGYFDQIYLNSGTTTF